MTLILNEICLLVLCYILTIVLNTQRLLLGKFNVVQSFSKKGYPFDNACCESFFKYLKKEECNRKNYHSIRELKLSLFEYIEVFYNLKRSHYSLGLMASNEKELVFYEH